MRGYVAESGVEEVCLEYFADLGWQVLHGPDIAPDEPKGERPSYRDVLLEGRLRDAISWLNPQLTSEAVDLVVATVRRPESADVMAENWRVYRLLTQGVPVEVRNNAGEARHDLARLIDFERPERNDFVVVNQMSVEQDNKTRRPDVLALVNGLPLGLIELKVPGQERATLRGAWNPATYLRCTDPCASCIHRRERHLHGHASKDGCARRQVRALRTVEDHRRYNTCPT
jgi:type I restriction enzyme R subunit